MPDGEMDEAALESFRHTLHLFGVFAFLLTADDADDLIGVMMAILERHGVMTVPDTLPADWS